MHPRCRGEPAGRERLILWKTKRKRKKMDDFVTEFNEKMAAKSREVCERIEREDAERRGGLSERERAILDMWPRFEDGERVWFGDEVEMQDEIVREVWTFTLDVNAEGDKRLYLNGFQGLFVLPGERVKRPTPEVLDADGVEIKVGDTVYGIGRNQHLYEIIDPHHIDPEVGEAFSVRCYDRDESAECHCRPELLTHTLPDSWERLEEDASKEPCFYFGFEDKPCDDGAGCPANKLGNCSKLKASDIIRRAKALAGVGVARDED